MLIFQAMCQPFIKSLKEPETKILPNPIPRIQRTPNHTAFPNIKQKILPTFSTKKTWSSTFSQLFKTHNHLEVYHQPQWDSLLWTFSKFPIPRQPSRSMVRQRQPTGSLGQAATAVAVDGNAVTKRQQGEGKALHWGPDHPSDRNWRCRYVVLWWVYDVLWQ